MGSALTISRSDRVIATGPMMTAVAALLSTADNAMVTAISRISTASGLSGRGLSKIPWAIRPVVPVESKASPTGIRAPISTTTGQSMPS